MVQKPIQNIFTVVFFMTFILVVVMAGVMAVTVLEELGIVQSGMILTSVDTDSTDSPPKSIPVHEYGRYNDCEVIYQQASQRSEFATISSETDEDGMATLYYAVYICTGSSVTAGSYI